MAAVRHLGFFGGRHGITHGGPFMAAIPCKNCVQLAAYTYMTFDVMLTFVNW